jgi:cold shock CspA family protein
MRAKVKWWNAEKGFGFVTDLESGEDIFLHYTEIQKEGFRNVTENEVVDYDRVEATKGPQATNVRTASDRDNEETPVHDAPQLDVDELIAATVVNGRLRLVALQPDGSATFLDGGSGLHSLLYVYSLESSVVRQSIDEFEDLINLPGVSELQIQRFLERQPEFLTGFDYSEAHPHIALKRDDGTRLIPDFALKPHNTAALCDLLDLKLPNQKLIVGSKDRRRFSQAITDAIAQLREYRDYFDRPEHRELVMDEYKLKFFKPRMFVVVGRRANTDPVALRKAELDVPAMTLTTYDDLLERARGRLRLMGGAR